MEQLEAVVLSGQQPPFYGVMQETPGDGAVLKPSYHAALALQQAAAGLTHVARLAASSNSSRATNAAPPAVEDTTFAINMSSPTAYLLAVWTTVNTTTVPVRLRVDADATCFQRTDHLGQAQKAVCSARGWLEVVATDAPQYLAPLAVAVKTDDSRPPGGSVISSPSGSAARRSMPALPAVS